VENIAADAKPASTPIRFFPVVPRWTHASPYVEESTRVDSLQVILKTVERCNLACPYCYYFFHGDDSALRRPAVMKKEVLGDVLRFIEQGIGDLRIRKVAIVFHGGEPMLQKQRAFDEMCTEIRSRIGPLTELHLSIQTNGTRFDDEWITLFYKHSVSIGISIDGPAGHHDKARPDWKGRGSHSLICDGISRLKRRGKEAGTSLNGGTITVLNLALSSRELFEHLTGELGFRSIAVLLPDRSWDKPFAPGETPELYGKQLCDLFDAWVKRMESTSVREIEDFLRNLQVYVTDIAPEEYDSYLPPLPPVRTEQGMQVRNQIVVLQSDGSISIDDSLIPALAWRKSIPQGNVRTTSLRAFLQHPAFGDVFHALKTLPGGCASCEWRNPCRGGSLENRYSSERQFDNPSVYCNGLKLFYRHVTEYLLANGYPREVLDAKLSGSKVKRDQCVEATAA
jgi:uncharacterized protein